MAEAAKATEAVKLAQQIRPSERVLERAQQKANKKKDSEAHVIEAALSVATDPNLVSKYDLDFYLEDHTGKAGDSPITQPPPFNNYKEVDDLARGGETSMRQFKSTTG